MKTFVVDIDGTICKTPCVDGVNRYDLSEPMFDRINKINKLYDEGNIIIYWTARGSGSGIDQTLATKIQLSSWGCKFTELRMYKLKYDVWIDDKAVSDEEFFK